MAESYQSISKTEQDTVDSSRNENLPTSVIYVKESSSVSNTSDVNGNANDVGVSRSEEPSDRTSDDVIDNKPVPVERYDPTPNPQQANSNTLNNIEQRPIDATTVSTNENVVDETVTMGDKTHGDLATDQDLENDVNDIKDNREFNTISGEQDGNDCDGMSNREIAGTEENILDDSKSHADKIQHANYSEVDNVLHSTEAVNDTDTEEYHDSSTLADVDLEKLENLSLPTLDYHSNNPHVPVCVTPVMQCETPSDLQAPNQYKDPDSNSHSQTEGPELFDDQTSSGNTELGGCDYILWAISVFVTVITFPVSIFLTIKMVQEYERAVIFRLGRLLGPGAKGPGIFFVVPCIDSYTKIDLRTVSFDVPPQEILTKDSVTVAVDAVVYYRISNATISVINVEDANRSTRLLAQTTLRNVLGTKSLSEILSDRDHISVVMQESLDTATDPWGVKVERVEVKDVRLPVQLQRAMAAEAEATREARAKVIASEGELNASRALKEASEVMAESPAALQLRYLQTLNAISAEKNSTIIFPLPVDILTHFINK